MSELLIVKKLVAAATLLGLGTACTHGAAVSRPEVPAVAPMLDPAERVQQAKEQAKQAVEDAKLSKLYGGYITEYYGISQGFATLNYPTAIEGRNRLNHIIVDSCVVSQNDTNNQLFAGDLEPSPKNTATSRAQRARFVGFLKQEFTDIVSHPSDTLYNGDIVAKTYEEELAACPNYADVPGVEDSFERWAQTQLPGSHVY